MGIFNKKTIIIIIVIAVFIWFFFREQTGTITMYQLEFFYIIIIMTILLMLFMFYYYKSRTPYLVTPTYWDSFAVEPVVIGEWVVFQTGGVKGLGIEGEGAAIFPRIHNKYNMQTYYTRTRLDKIHYMQTPVETRNYLQEKGIDREKIYGGKYLWQHEVKDPKLAVNQVSERLDEHDFNYARAKLEQVADTEHSADSMAEEKMKAFSNQNVIEATKDALNSKMNKPPE